MAALEHIIFMKAKAGREAELDAVLPECERLVAGVPGVEAVAMGRNSMEGAPGGFTHATRVLLADPSFRPGFGPHPLHRSAAELMHPFIESIAIVDFDAEGAGAGAPGR